MKMAIRVERILGSVTSGLPFGTQPIGQSLRNYDRCRQ